jgi:hypothetical protein
MTCGIAEACGAHPHSRELRKTDGVDLYVDPPPYPLLIRLRLSWFLSGGGACVSAILIALAAIVGLVP